MHPREHNEDNYQSHESKWVACHSLPQHSWFYFLCHHPPKHATLRGHPRADISSTKPHPSFGNTNKNWQELMQEKKADVVLNETCQNCVYSPHISKIQYCTMQLQVRSKTHRYSTREPSIPPEPVVCLERQNQQSIIQCLDALNQHWKGQPVLHFSLHGHWATSKPSFYEWTKPNISYSVKIQHLWLQSAQQNTCIKHGIEEVSTATHGPPHKSHWFVWGNIPPYTTFSTMIIHVAHRNHVNLSSFLRKNS